MQKYFYELKKENRNLTIRQYVYRIGQYRYNWHKALEVLLVVNGSLEMSCGGETILLKEDDLLLINSNVGHASLAKEENCMAMVIQIEPEYLEEYYHPIRNWSFSGHTTEENRYESLAAEIRAIMAAMQIGAGSEDPMEKIRYEQELNRLCYLLFRLFPPEHRQEADSIRTERQQDMMEKILAYVEENYQEKITLQDLSHLCQYNPSYLSVYFKNHVGVNFYDYLTRIRVREATFELCSTNNTVLDVANRHGFPDVKAFNIAFRKTFGKAPMEYRQQILEEDRGKELMEKRTFLPVTDETVNRKLAQYQNAVIHPFKEEFSGQIQIREKLAESLQTEIRASSDQADELKKRLTEMERHMEELKNMLRFM
jgi:AraC-like DNA-binding protein/mannose-6-phosphate isomerase-like protein (cupin superfamily)